MDQRLEEAARVGDIDTLYSLIKENKSTLEEVDKVLFINTPLHIAAVAGKNHFAMEIMRLKPSYSRKLNEEGYSPIHLALHNGQTKLVFRLLDVDAHLVRVQGREGKTALHVVAEYGMVDLLAQFLAVCPKSIKDLTIHKETALHIAVKNNNLDSVAVLLGWLEHVGKDVVLKWTDHQGNTVLHISVHNNHIEMTNLLLGRVTINARNLEGLTALDIIENPRQSNYVKLRIMLLRAGAMKGSSLPPVSTLAESMKTKMSWHERLVMSDYRRKIYMSNDDRNAVLVVAILIATSNYQAVLTSSYSDHSHTIWPLFTKVFSIVNSTAFLASMFEIYLLLPHGYGVLQLVLPLVIFITLLMAELDTLMPVMILLCVFYCFKWPVVLHKLNPIFVYKKSMRIKRSIFKHCSSFHREIDDHEA